VFKNVQRWFVSPSRQVLKKYRKSTEDMLGAAILVSVCKHCLRGSTLGALRFYLWDIVANMCLCVLQVARGCGGLLLLHSFS
jgi:hypothetical protein